MVQQSQRREWRKRRRRRNRLRILLKLVIVILILCTMGYGGKKIFDIYIAKASKGNETTEITDTTDSTDDTDNTNAFDSEKESSETDSTETPNSMEKPDISETSDGASKPDEAKKPDNTEKPDAITTPDETKENDETDKSGETKKPGSSDQADGANNSDDTKAPDNKNEDDNSEKMDDSYFDDAVFIGDSRTEGFGMYSGLKKATFYSEKGLMVDTIFKDNVIKINGNKVTIMEALKKKSFAKVYIMLGVNELGWPYDDVFIDYYKKVIDAIKESQPQAVIYIQSIIRVSKEKDKNPPNYINNKRIDRRNELIKKMAEKESVYYLDANEVLTDNSGYLFTEASTDGIHLNQQYCLIWKDYLLNHTSK